MLPIQLSRKAREVLGVWQWGMAIWVVVLLLLYLTQCFIHMQWYDPFAYIEVRRFIGYSFLIVMILISFGWVTVLAD